MRRLQARRRAAIAALPARGAGAAALASIAIICFMHILPGSTQRLTMASYRSGATLA